MNDKNAFEQFINKENKSDSISLEVFKQSGKKGGSKTALRGHEYFVEIGKKGALKRWKKNDLPNTKEGGLQGQVQA